MRRQDAFYVATCAGAVAFCVVFVLAHFVPSLPVLWYYPLDRSWELAPKSTGLAMDFYGRLLYATIAWAVAVVGTLAITRRLKTERLPAKLASLLAAWTIALSVLVMLYYVWTLAFRVPVAAPIPDWYVPR